MALDKTSSWVKLQDHRKYLVINMIAYVGIAVHLILIPLFYWLNLEILSLFNVLSSLMWIYAWLSNRDERHNLAIFLMTSEVILHTMVVVPITGWHAGFQYYLFAAVPFTLFNNKLEGSIIVLVSVGLCALFVMLSIYTHNIPSGLTLSHDVVSIFNNVNIIISFTALCVISYFFRLASSQLENELEKQAHTDPLTGLYNRRRMTDVLVRHEALTARYSSALSIVFVDIDHFKKINDKYGHDCGDYVLGAVANFISQRLRKTDIVARWGGEEFLILLPGTNLDGARLISEKIRAAIGEQTFQVGGQSLVVTMTFGICQHQADRPLEESLKYADMALYKGKQAGRNIVMSHP